MRKLLLLLSFLTSCLSMGAIERSWELSMSGLQPLIWEEVVQKAELLKKNAASAQRVENAIVAAKLTGLAAFFCWLCYVLPPPDSGTAIKRETTVQLDVPKDVQGGVLKTAIGALWGATNVVATVFCTTIIYWLGGIVKDSGIAFASALGVCDKPVHKVEKYYDIAMELIKSAVASAHDYDVLVDQDKKMKQQEMIETNIILLLQAIEITLARMILEVNIVHKHSKLSANAAFKVVHEIFETTNQKVAVINIRFGRQEGICDVLDHWSTQLKKQGDRFKLFAWSTDY